jgi:hypothetical protein
MSPGLQAKPSEMEQGKTPAIKPQDPGRLFLGVSALVTVVRARNHLYRTAVRWREGTQPS